MSFPDYAALKEQVVSVTLLLAVVIILAFNQPMHPGLQASLMGTALWLARPLAQGYLHYLRIAGMALCALLVVLTGVELLS